MPRISHASIFVNDQDRARSFYTDVLGFELKVDLPTGEFRWLTVVSDEDPAGTQLVLEPNNNAVALNYQQALYRQQIPAIVFVVDDVDYEHERLRSLGVHFVSEPTVVSNVKSAILDDTCGNYIQLTELLD